MLQEKWGNELGTPFARSVCIASIVGAFLAVLWTIGTFIAAAQPKQTTPLTKAERAKSMKQDFKIKDRQINVRMKVPRVGISSKGY